MRTQAVVFIALAAACGAETGNGLGPTIAMRATQSGSGLHVAQEPAVLEGRDAQGARLTVAHARASIRSIELMSPGGKLCHEEDYRDSGFEVRCDSAKIRIEGPIVVDLMTGASLPSLERVVVPAATYSRVDVRLGKAERGEVLTGADPLIDNTLVADGELTFRNEATPYDVQLHFEEDARFESASGVEVNEGAAERLLLLLDVSAWFSNLPLTTCLEEGDLEEEDGRIPIRDRGQRCSAVEKDLKDAIKGSSRLGKGPK